MGLRPGAGEDSEQRPAGWTDWRRRRSGQDYWRDEDLGYSAPKHGGLLPGKWVYGARG